MNRLAVVFMVLMPMAAFGAGVECESLLDPSGVQRLMDHKVFISQFTAGIDRERGDAICVPVAAVNAAHMLYHSVTGRAAYPEVSIKFVNEVWVALTGLEGIIRTQGLPFEFSPAIALGAAHAMKLLDQVVPVGINGPQAVRNQLQELIPTRSRVRVIGLRDGVRYHVVTAVGFDVLRKQLIVLDPNEDNISRRLALTVTEGAVRLSPVVEDEKILPLHSSLSSPKAQYDVVSVFGLNIKDPPKAANDE